MNISRTPSRSPGFARRSARHRLLVLSSACLALSSSALAADATWTGSFSTSLTNGANWSSTSATFAANETATWNGTQAGDLSLLWNAGLGPGSGNTGGLNISVTAANTGGLILDGAGTNRLGVGNVTIASGAGAFTFGDGAGTAQIVMRNPSQTFTNDSANTATIKSDVQFFNGGGVGNRVVTIGGTGNWTVEGAFISSDATFGFGTSAATASLVKNGNGILTLAGANNHGGGTTINAGTVAVSNGGALGTGNVTLSARLQVSNNITLGGVANYNLSGFANVPSGVATSARIQNVSGNNTISGNINFANVGGTHLNILSSAGTLTLSGAITNTVGTGVSTASRTFNFTGAGNISSTGLISDGTSGIALNKEGSGTLTLSGANSYTKGTTITAGTLSAGNASALGAGDLLISGGTLSSSVASVSGLGNVTFSSGALDLNSGGVGALSLASGKTFAMSGGTWSASLASTSSYDQVFGSGASFSLTGGTLSLSGVPDYNFGYALFSGFTAGTVSGVSITGYDSVNWTASLGTNGVLSFTSAIPEPSSIASLAGLAVLGLAARRRRTRA